MIHYKPNNILKSPEDIRDYKFSFFDLPTHVDLLPDVEEIEDQKTTSSCAANAAASAMEIAYKRAGESKDFSRLFIYWYARKLGGVVGDNGVFARDICRALKENGVCLEKTWEFNDKNLNAEPSEEARNEAKQYPVYEYAKLVNENIVIQIKQSVYSGIPVLTSLKISTEFQNLGKNWKVHDWNPNKNHLGDHAVIIIGYDDQSERFLAQNSWGAEWGDGGFFGIPYSRIGTDSYTDYYYSSKSAYEYWILTKLAVPYIKV